MAKRAVLRSLSDIDIRLVRIFVTVTECGGFAASELELNIGRSTISRHIVDLETRLGLTLCNRGPSGFSLTQEGEQVLRSARRLLTSLDGFQSEIDNIHSHLTGNLRIGLFDQSTTNPRAHLHHAIAQFDDIAPKVRLDIVLGPPNELEAKVLDGSLDIAVVPIHRRSTALHYAALYEEAMTLYCGETHPLFSQMFEDKISKHALSKYKFAGFDFNSPNMKAAHDLGLHRAAQVQEEEALSLLIQSGRYLGFLADHVAETFLNKGKVRAVAPELTHYVVEYAAIYRKKPLPERKLQEFVGCLKRAHLQNNNNAAD